MSLTYRINKLTKNHAPHILLSVEVFVCLAVLLIFQTSAALAQYKNELQPYSTGKTAKTADIYTAFNTFNNSVRDGLISRSNALKKLEVNLAEIEVDYRKRGGIDYQQGKWVFPVAGHDYRSIEKRGSHGFTAKGYDYFTGNRHGGHPAYDIFIRDRNQDNLDDRSGNPVKIVSMTSGIIIASENHWSEGSRLRGGKYIWVYDPGNKLFIYYAHNEEIYVTPGTIVKPGDLLATMGRTGLNAAKRRSPTHLHFSVLRIVKGKPVPVPVYSRLRNAITVQ